MSARTGHAAPAARRPARSRLRLPAAAVPLVWAPFVLVHPASTPFSGTAGELGLWLTVHLAQLVLAPFLALAVWALVAGVPGAAARTTQVALSLWLAFFSAFDAIAGIATARLAQQAQRLPGEERHAVVDAVTRLFDDDPLIGGGLSVLSLLAQPLWLVVAASAAVALHLAGARTTTVVALAVSALLATHGGPLAALGLVALAVALLTHVRRPGPADRPAAATTANPR